MLRAIGAVVHESMKPEDAYEQYVRPALQQSPTSTEVA
jgi:hypothetical protein